MTYTRLVLPLFVVWICIYSSTMPTAHGGDALDTLYRFFKKPHDAHGRLEPRLITNTTVEQLAREIDWLEHHIDRYGSVVAKHANVWGEARLTKHRDEYERLLRNELNQFSFRINARQAQADGTFLANMFALQAAVAPPGTTLPAPAAVTSPPSAAAAAAITSGRVPANAFSAFPKEGTEEAAVGIEPTVYLDQLSRYLNHLMELRRINEGDDTSDSPGYSLNLVRLPVSVVPGKHTRKGYGAEITVTAEPYLSDALLPVSMRNLIINDLVDQLGLVTLRVTELEVPTLAEEPKKLKAASKTFDAHVKELLDVLPDSLEKEYCPRLQIPDRHVTESIDRLKVALADLENELTRLRVAVRKKKVPLAKELADLTEQLPKGLQRDIANPTQWAATESELAKIAGRIASDDRAAPRYRSEALNISQRSKQLDNQLAVLGNSQAALSKLRAAESSLGELVSINTQVWTVATTASGSSRSRRARHPLPPSQVFAVYGVVGARLSPGAI